MKLKIIAVTIMITLTSISRSSHAQNQENELQKLHTLCANFPLNSRCQGKTYSIHLKERPGDTAECSLMPISFNTMNKCKVIVNDKELIAYVEEGETIAALENQRATREIRIAFTDVFSWSAESWVNRNNRAQGYSEMEIGVINQSSYNEQNRSKFLKVVPTSAKTLALILIHLPSKNKFPTEVLFVEKPENRQNLGITKSDNSEQVKQLLATKICIRCDLRGANLKATDLEGANLEGANLQDANLEKADLEKAYLVGANLVNTNLEKANLHDAVLVYASLEKSKLSKASLNGANLQNANLQDAILSWAKLKATGRRTTYLKNANLKNADLSYAQLMGVNLAAANLANANLQGANLSDIAITKRGIFFTPRAKYNHRTNLIGADLSGANLSSADLTQADLRGANLSSANLKSTRLKGVNMQRANLRGADLSGASLEGSNLYEATMPDGSKSESGLWTN